MRLFLALNLVADARAALAEATAPMRAAAPSVRWTAEAQLHLTMKFLGEQPDEAVESVASELVELARGHQPFDLRIEGLGAFPSQRRPRIVWAGVVTEPRLELLHHDVEAMCALLGFPLEGRAFRPPVTLGRADRLAPAELEPLTRAARGARVAIDSPVTTVDLMRSELSSSGARHSRVAAATLGGA